MAAYKAQIKYLCLQWDAPSYNLYSPFGRMDNCYFTVFDKVDYERLVGKAVPHVLYQPLSIDINAAAWWNARKKNYLHDISFVGSLYDDNLYDNYMQNIPEALQQYFNSIFDEAAFRWDGVNRIYGKTGKDVLAYIKASCPGFELINPFDIDDIQYFEAYYLARKLANIERICILNLLAEEHEVTFYTGSKKAISKLQNVKVMPFVNDRTEAPAVFNGSKINLNITLKSIEGGTPQRVMDIMESGGFVLTTYCPETAELFEEDKEIVMFKTPEELMDKVDYYLVHDEERQKIAAAGHAKVLRCYTWDIKMREFMKWVEEQ